MTAAQDPVVEANRKMLKDRSDLGIQKYGHMLNRTDLTLRDWLQHALEETLDQANYLQAAIMHIDKQWAVGLNDVGSSDLEINPATHSVNGQMQDYTGLHVLENHVIVPDDYQRLACRTAPPGEAQVPGLAHCALGLSTEAGEYTTEVKRMAIYNKPMTDDMRAHMIEELGDILWYVAYACAILDASLGVVMQQNIDKLRKRFPDKFSGAAAEARADKGGVDARNS